MTNQSKGSYRVFTGSKDKYEELSDKTEFKNVHLFDMAAAIGIKRNERKTYSTEWEGLLNLYSVDKERIMESLVRLEHENESEETVIKILQEHAEAGINILYKDWKETENIDVLNRYVPGETIEWED